MTDTDIPFQPDDPTPDPSSGSPLDTTSIPIRRPGRSQEPVVEEQEAEEKELERPGGLLSKVDGHLVMYHDPSGLQAEQYRACRTNLSALNRAGAPWAIVVTSSKRGEGKSITAANLAACLAEVPGTKVCVLDLDSRAPGLGSILGVDMDRGVTELIKGDVSLNQVRVPTVVPNLDVICAGVEPDSPAELLGCDQFVNHMEELKRRYSWIILDAPPVNPWTDACVVSALVEGALVVVRLQETPRSTVNRSIDLIGAAGGRIIGTFLTGLVPDRVDAGHYAYGYPRQDGYEWGAENEQPVSAGPTNRSRAEKRLRKQERQLLKQQTKQRKREDDEDTLV
jgi:capsular exopolysaccharide synthesis family protein